MIKRKFLIVIILISTLVLGLIIVLIKSRQPETVTVKTTPSVETVVTVPPTTAIPTAKPAEIVPTPTEIVIPTPVIPQSEAREKIRQTLINYGRVDDLYLSDWYWTRLSQNIDQYGPAQRILVLEYHGDNYYMYDGSYSMTPESFEHDMRWLMENNYHFVTGAEMLGFIEGWLDLPKRSIFLTTDSGNKSDTSMDRIIPLFAKLLKEYGYPPHMNSYLWTQAMDENESASCLKDACWEIYRRVLDSGFFTLGTHTETHEDFNVKRNQAQTEWDLSESINNIKTNLGVTVYSLTWPFEACSAYPQTVSDVGIKYAFGGWTRITVQLFTYKSDNMPLCLPRLFPPNPDGYSGRPNGLTLEEMLLLGEEDIPLQ